MKDNKQVSIIQKILFEIEKFKFHNLQEFTLGETQWWYSHSQDIVMAMKNGEHPNIFTDDWIFVLETKDSSVAIKGQDDKKISANETFQFTIEAILKENLICIGALVDSYRLAPNMSAKRSRADEIQEAYDRREIITKSIGIEESSFGLSTRSNWLEQKQKIDSVL